MIKLERGKLKIELDIRYLIQVICLFKGHSWSVLYDHAFGESRPFCWRCDTERGAPKFKEGDSFATLGIKILN